MSRDEAMETSWDEIGFNLDSRREGPFIIGYRPAPWTSLRIQALEDPYARTGFAFDPYEARLVGSGFSLISITTPPLDSEFTTELMAAFVTSLGRAQA